MTKSSKRVLYSLHTEYRANLRTVTNQFFDCFTVYKSVGYWKGMPEKGARVDIIGTEADRQQVVNLADAIRVENCQEAVYVTVTPTTLLGVWSPFEAELRG